MGTQRSHRSTNLSRTTSTSAADLERFAAEASLFDSHFPHTVNADDPYSRAWRPTTSESMRGADMR